MVIGKTVLLANDSLAMLSPGASGANQTWNFATLQQHVVDTLTIDAPTGHPGASSYPSANVHLNQNGSDAYLMKNSSGVYFIGVVPATVPPFSYNPSWEVLALPNTYGTTFNNNTGYQIKMPYTSTPPADSVWLKHTEIRSAITDAWGTLVLPSGSYNSIRMHTTTFNHDSIFAHIPILGWQYVQESIDTIVTYDWFAKNMYYPILSIDSSYSSGLNQGVQYVKGVMTDIPLVDASSSHVFPNPVNNTLYISMPSRDANLNIYDVNGNVILNTKSDNGSFTLSMSDYAPGVYWYSVSSEQSGKSSKGSFVVQH
jgi:hypothetical protein